MSWDASLYHSNGVCVFDQNYTHNCNAMIESALGDAITGTREPFWCKLGVTGMGRGSWWDLLYGRPATEAATLLRGALAEFDADPDRFRAMNPENGWGSFDSVRDVLRKMADQSELWPDGYWEVSG